ncbi:MAG: nickel pincer cofactor biosynthesis protein LarB [Actinomycetota bacterium]
MDEATISTLLQRVADGDRTVSEALADLRDLPFEDIGSAKIDHHRELRTGQAEAVYAPGKSPREVRDAAVALAGRTAGAVFVTRATAEQAAQVADAIPDARYDERSRLVIVKGAAPNGDLLGTVAVLSAGTADLPVAQEAALTLGALGVEVDRIADVGVAGVHRLLDHRHRIESADCLVVVAGMEGALPSVVAGLTSRPVIAVPTSVGYGASFEGLAALLTMLASCAPGISVVNIDNGFGAGLVAHRILRARSR